MIPTQWLIGGVAGFALLAGLSFLHGREVRQALLEAESRGETRAYARIEAKAKDLEARAARLVVRIRKDHDENDRRIAALADGLRLRGPGKASCPGTSPRGAAAGGHQPAGRPGNAAVDLVPDREGEQLIALPFAELVAQAERCDLNRNEALSWRQRWQEMSAAPTP